MKFNWLGQSLLGWSILALSVPSAKTAIASWLIGSSIPALIPVALTCIWWGLAVKWYRELVKANTSKAFYDTFKKRSKQAEDFYGG